MLHKWPNLEIVSAKPDFLRTLFRNPHFVHHMTRMLKLLASAAIIFSFLPVQARPEVITSDINKDGKPDGWTYVTNGYVDKQEIDINFDGKIDTVYVYEGDGKIKEEVLDTNYDGKMDNWRLFNNGSLVMDRIDSNGDGKADYWFYVDKGRIYKIEKDTNHDGTADSVTEFH